MNGLTTYGAAGPTQYNAVTGPISAYAGIVTGFPSWDGSVDPTGAYANELGNRMTFGLTILGNGTQFSISELSFTAFSDDPYDGLGLSPAIYGSNPYPFAAGDYEYSSDYVGVIYDNGVDTSGGVTYYTGTDNTTLVNALYARGTGDSYAADCSEGPCATPAEQQALIDAVAAYPGTQVDFTAPTAWQMPITPPRPGRARS
jgi:hypothetical protein